MASSSLYRQLVPDAPQHRRTERDVYPSPEAEARAKLAGRLAPRLAQPGLQKPALISSWQGAIETLLLAFPAYGIASRELIVVGTNRPIPLRPFYGTREDDGYYVDIAGDGAGTYQPIFHIDMFITPAGREEDGRYRVLVGDPSLAADLLGERVAPHAMRPVFDSVAHVLERLGFEVIRNPLPLVYVDDPVERVRLWYFATANNALVEPGRVILPTYGHGAWESLEVVDRANADLWRSLGYEVVELVDCHPLAEALGVVHCIKKYLRRST